MSHVTLYTYIHTVGNELRGKFLLRIINHQSIANYVYMYANFDIRMYMVSMYLHPLFTAITEHNNPYYHTIFMACYCTLKSAEATDPFPDASLLNNCNTMYVKIQM